MDETQSILEKITPLREVCIARNYPLPQIEAIGREELPQPYRDLLVHDGSMTLALEHFHEQSIYIEVVSKRMQGHVLLREVILRRYGDDLPVEYGTIRLAVGWLSPEIRAEITEGRRPLGKIFAEQDVAYHGCPVAYIRAMPTEHIAECLKVGLDQPIYGRINRLFNDAWHPIADVVELLPNLDAPAHADAIPTKESNDAASSQS